MENCPDAKKRPPETEEGSRRNRTQGRTGAAKQGRPGGPRLGPSNSNFEQARFRADCSATKQGPPLVDSSRRHRLAFTFSPVSPRQVGVLGLCPQHLGPSFPTFGTRLHSLGSRLEAMWGKGATWGSKGKGGYSKGGWGKGRGGRGGKGFGGGGAAAGGRGGRGKGAADGNPDGDDNGSTDVALADMQDDALVVIMRFALEDYCLLALSLVCRRWSELVRLEDVWEGKVIDFVDRPRAIETLREWYPRWRRAMVEMTYAEKDALVSPNVQRHLIFHPWAGCPWEGTVIDGQQWLLCLTRCRGPLDAHVFQDLADSEAFTAPILLGWTSATSHREVTLISKRIRAGTTRASDVLMAIAMCPASLFEELYRDDIHDVEDPPPCFHDNSPWIGRMQFNVEDSSVTIHTAINEEETSHLVGERIQYYDELRFFVAVQTNARARRARMRLPRVSLRPTLYAPS